MTRRYFARGKVYCAAAFGGLTVLSACVGQQGPNSTGATGEIVEVQPRVATYDCGKSGSITIENNRTSIRITGADGQDVQLPEAPESLGTRYVQDGTAVVIEGREALVMAGRNEPVSCRR